MSKTKTQTKNKLHHVLVFAANKLIMKGQAPFVIHFFLSMDSLMKRFLLLTPVKRLRKPFFYCVFWREYGVI